VHAKLLRIVVALNPPPLRHTTTDFVAHVVCTHTKSYSQQKRYPVLRLLLMVSSLLLVRISSHLQIK
jgi:hypothetical protein